MEKNNSVISEKTEETLKLRTEVEVKLLERLSGEDLRLLNELIDAFIKYEDCLAGKICQD